MLLDKPIPIGFILNKVKTELLLTSLYVIAIEILDEIYQVKGIFIPVAIPAILGTTISLILGFRLNQAYDRWWEARKIWGSIVNDSRTLLRQSLSFLPDDLRTTTVNEIKNLQIAWCYALARSLKGQEQQDIQRYLNEEQLSLVTSAGHIPNSLLHLQSEILENCRKKGHLTDFQHMLTEQTITRLCDAMGRSERIANTVFPKTYSKVVEFLLYIFIILLPFGLIEYLGYLVGTLLILFTIPFFLLEKSAIHLQDPFKGYQTDVPVFKISETIENNLNKMVNPESPVISRQKQEKYFIL
ncbi:bestrophin family protein [Robertkochia aurantiaca]|uniref:bestrophin family protein n=1 Tax=Robertkochia aurantiaca TaxID=2873700 RepID=UPI001CD022B5|nr:bestrophin family ion channel [Robertkochia sp. 3YJGBD-33]